MQQQQQQILEKQQQQEDPSSSAMSFNMKSEVNKRIRDPSLINDERLRMEVINCVLCDDNYSPLIEKIRHTVGAEYEYILQEKLHNLSIGSLSMLS
jgi:hypothetical protein